MSEIREDTAQLILGRILAMCEASEASAAEYQRRNRERTGYPDVTTALLEVSRIRAVVEGGHPNGYFLTEQEANLAQTGLLIMISVLEFGRAGTMPLPPDLRTEAQGVAAAQRMVDAQALATRLGV